LPPLPSLPVPPQYSQSLPTTPLKTSPCRSESLDPAPLSLSRAKITYDRSIHGHPNRHARPITADSLSPLLSEVPALIHSPPEAQTLSHALRAQQQKYDLLLEQFQQVEAVKDHFERRTAMLEEEASKQAQELQGLRWLVMNGDSDPLPNRDAKLKRSRSVPVLATPPQEDSVEHQPQPPASLPLEITNPPVPPRAARRRAGLGIAISPSSRHGQPTLPVLHESQLECRVSDHTTHVEHLSVNIMMPDTPSRCPKRSNTIDTLNLLQNDLRTFIQESQPTAQ